MERINSDFTTISDIIEDNIEDEFNEREPWTVGTSENRNKIKQKSSCAEKLKYPSMEYTGVLEKYGSR